MQTADGEHIAKEISSNLTNRERIVVKGAYGIEGAAHRASLTAGGGTFVILTNCMKQLYPSGNRGSLEHITGTVILVSEAVHGNALTHHRFVARSRLIATHSDTTLWLSQPRDPIH